jgi:hypothetical protein
MADLYHVVLKDHENSGYVWDEFFCPTCLEKWVTKSNHLEILCQTMASPQYLSRVYPPLGERTPLPRVRRHFYLLIQSIPMKAW